MKQENFRTLQRKDLKMCPASDFVGSNLFLSLKAFKKLHTAFRNVSLSTNLKHSEPGPEAGVASA